MHEVTTAFTDKLAFVYVKECYEYKYRSLVLSFIPWSIEIMNLYDLHTNINLIRVQDIS